MQSNKKNTLNFFMSKRHKPIIPHKGGKKRHEKMLNIISHEENVNKNHKEIPFHTHWNSSILKD